MKISTSMIIAAGIIALAGCNKKTPGQNEASALEATASNEAADVSRAGESEASNIMNNAENKASMVKN